MRFSDIGSISDINIGSGQPYLGGFDYQRIPSGVGLNADDRFVASGKENYRQVLFLFLLCSQFVNENK